MKNLYTFLLLFTCGFLNAQIVNIPDANFKNALIEEGVDTNGDGEIQVSEAETVVNLNVSFKGIQSMEGIQSFVNLEELYCNNNQLTSLDISQNVNLQVLICADNQLSNLDVTQNINLKSLLCWDNPLGSIDVSQNLNLEGLLCTNTQLSDLDVSQNINLIGLDCSDNQLSTLDLTANINLLELYCRNKQLTSLFIDNGNNQNLYTMVSLDNPNLACIQVDDETAIRPEYQGLPLSGWCKDEWTNYSEDCSLGIAVAENFNFHLYPNPAKNHLVLTSKNTTGNLKVKIYNPEGKLLRTQNVTSEKQVSIDVSQLSSGIYF